jgi:MFS family permease
VERIWETWLATLILCGLFLITLHLDKEERYSRWAGFGALWGFGALTSPAMLSVLPFLAGWVIYRRHRRGRRWFLLNAVAAIAFVAVVAPWFVRNYAVFHRFIPFRDSMGMVLRLGTQGKTDYWGPYELGPWHNPAEWSEFQQAGELAYMDHKKQQAIEFIKNRPGWFAWATMRRIVFIWTGYWSLDREYLKDEPLDPPNIVFCTALTVLMLIGLRRALKSNWLRALPYALVLFSFPLIYYITSPEVYYRRPIDPIFVILAVVALVPGAGRPPLKKRSLELKEEGDPEVAYSTT